MVPLRAYTQKASLQQLCSLLCLNILSCLHQMLQMPEENKDEDGFL